MNKFRVWCKILNKFDYNLAICRDSVLVLSSRASPSGLYTAEPVTKVISCNKKNLIVQFFTGLLARNGEIYEGDIVRFVQKDGDEIVFQDIGIVKYSHAAFIVDGSNWGKDDHYLGDYVVEGNTTELEIIGNVMENPEILEKSNK